MAHRQKNIDIEARKLVKGTDGTLSAYVALEQVQGSGNLKVKKDYASMDEAEDAWGVSRRNFTTVYFYNADGWDKVGAYTWDAASIGDWPGGQMEEDGDGWYKLRIDAVPGANFNIIFNNYVGDGDRPATSSPIRQTRTSKKRRR